MNMRAIKVAALVGAMVFGAVEAARADVVIAAAASTTESMNEIAAAFNATGKGKMVPSFGASLTLARQIESGSPAVIFLSADERSMDYAADKKLIVTDTRKDILGNSLVLVEPADSTDQVTIAPGFPIAAILKGGRLAMGDPATVPAGAYGQQALTKLNVWDSVKDHLAVGNDVRGVLAFVETKSVPFGIVYSTDAAASSKVKVAATFPESSHPPVTYPLALVAGKDTPEARAALAFIEGPDAQAIFAKRGFVILK